MTDGGGQTGLRPLVGREQELGCLDQFLEAAGEAPAGLQVEGEPGIGKSVLWEWAVHAAREKPYSVLSYRAVKAEATFGYAGLADLLDPVLDTVQGKLSDLHRRALDGALLRVDATPERIEPRAIAHAVLQILRVLAAAGPVLVAVDDMQWLDEASIRTLAFATRRLDREPIGVLIARRSAPDEGIFELERLLPEPRVSRLCVGPLPAADLVQVMLSRIPVALPRGVIDRIVRQAGGNPFYALELGRAVDRDTPSRSANVAVPPHVRTLVAKRVTQLPMSTRLALFCASAMVTPRISVISAAMGRTDGRVPSLARAEKAGVIEVQNTVVRFTHPLLASAVHASTPLGEQRRLHRALARVADDPEHVAHHRGRGAIGPDEEIADQLEQAARRAARRGAPAASAELCALAAELTPAASVERLLARRVATADYLTAAGDTARARDLLVDVVAVVEPGLGRARALHALARVQWHLAGYRGARPPLEQALPEADGDPAVRGQIMADLARCYARDDQRVRAWQIMPDVIALARQTGDCALLSRGLSTFARLEFLLGRGVRRDLFEQAITAASFEADAHTHIAARIDFAASVLGARELDDARTQLDGLHSLVAARGDEMRLTQVLAMRAELEVASGQWQQSLELSDAALDAAARAEQEPLRGEALRQKAYAFARLGLVEDARALIGDPTLSGSGSAARQDVWDSALHGFIALSLGDFGAAHGHLDGLRERIAAYELFDPSAYEFLADEAEALIGLGRYAEARTPIEWLADRGHNLDRPWAIATAARCQSLLHAREGRLDIAFTDVDQALAAHERLSMPFELARTLLVKGTIERHARRKSPARQTLQAALALFEELGAQLWAQTARAELARVGGRAPSPGHLTPTERSVADLVATGRSNQEVARLLFVSAKTVEWNLTKVYRKLHVRSRAELAAKLPRLRG